MPLDPVVSSSAAARGVEMIYGDINEVATLLHGEKFDCILCLNVLHLAHDPVAVLSRLKDCSCDNSTVIIQTPNMFSLRTVRQTVRDMPILHRGKDYSSTGVHLSTVRRAKNWCARSGMKVGRTIGVLDRREQARLEGSRPRSVISFQRPLQSRWQHLSSCRRDGWRMSAVKRRLWIIHGRDARRAVLSSEGPKLGSCFLFPNAQADIPYWPTRRR